MLVKSLQKRFLKGREGYLLTVPLRDGACGGGSGTMDEMETVRGRPKAVSGNNRMHLRRAPYHKQHGQEKELCRKGELLDG